MVGQIEVINALLCVYLVYKGYEIFQAAHLNIETKKVFRILSILAFIGSIIMSVGFFVFMELYVVDTFSNGNNLNFLK